MYLNIIVLKALADRRKTGYDLMKYIAEHTGWKVSPGSMYPLLNSLLKRKEVSQKVSGRKKFYIITSKGKKSLEESRKLKEKMILEAQSNIRIMGDLCGFHDAPLISDMIGRFKDSEAPFGDMTYHMIEFRKQLLGFALDKKRFQKNKSKLREILLDTTKKLSELK